MKPAASRVQAALAALGLDRAVLELPVDARTSPQAAEAVGVGVGQIAKSLVFTVDGAPVMVVASGVNRVDERKLARLAGGKVRRADAATVRQATGFAIGGVPPLGHETALPIWVDEDLLAHDLIYAAAGVPDCVFPLSPDELVRATGGQVADVKETRSLKGERA
jgi:prolyl-tRNA editing enzyme YbaK/EbsC (Cys-tRNA(Pro) deacylase)